MLTYCKTCHADLYDGKTLFGHEHKCPPKWDVWRDGEQPDDGNSFHAHEASTAVEMWADWYDRECAEYLIARDTCVTAWACPAGGGEPVKFAVRGEFDPVYYATEAKK